MSNRYTEHDGYSILTIVSRKHGIFQVLVDTELVEQIGEYRWCIAQELTRRAGHQYSVRAPNSAGFLSRHIIGAPAGLYVDHINSNPLDNRRQNLRLVTPRGNSWNRVDARGYYRAGENRWKASIMVDGRSTHLGYFGTEAEAAAAYARAKRARHQVQAVDPAGTFGVPEDPSSL